MRGTRKRIGLMGALFALALVAAACGDDASAGSAGSDELSMQIASPAEGAEVSQTFTVTVDASVPLDDPDTGEHHVHLCFDGANCDAEYQLVYGNTFEVSDLGPGEHTITASLRNADHSDAGPTDEIAVTVVGGGGGGDEDPEGSGTSGPTGGGFGY